MWRSLGLGVGEVVRQVAGPAAVGPEAAPTRKNSTLPLAQTQPSVCLLAELVGPARTMEPLGLIHGSRALVTFSRKGAPADGPGRQAGLLLGVILHLE